MSSTPTSFVSRRHDDPAAWSVCSSAGVVATAHHRASEAAAAVLRDGGNAIDAAVTASLMLGVCEPAGSGLGGMTMMVVHLASPARTFVLEGPCRAPAAATPKLAETHSRRLGYRAVAVPSNAAVLAYAHARYGQLARERLIEPAIDAAAAGIVISPLQRKLLQTYRRSLRKGNAAYRWLTPDGEALSVGSRVTQPELATTLRRLAAAGFEDLYVGDLARTFAADMAARGGYITADDLAQIPWPSEVEPLRGSFGELEVCSLAPPGGGTALLQMLHVYDALDLDPFDPDAAMAAVMFAAIIRRARVDRRMRSRKGAPADAPDLHSVEHARVVAAQLREQWGSTGASVGPTIGAWSPGNSSGETSHVSIIDRFGNAVAMTQSIERSFGSKVVTPQLGFFHNGYLKAYKLTRASHPNYLRPGAPARSNAGPTLALRDGKVALAVGSTGSERLNSGVFQVLARLRAGQAPFKAVAAPRLHCTPEGEVMCEHERFDPAAIAALREHGYQIAKLDPWSFKTGGLQLAVRDDGVMQAVADPRRDGSATAAD